MKNKYFQPYGLDMQYEYKTYKYVGMDYGNWKVANLGLVLNVKRFVRKYITNKKEKQYKKCDSYTEWQTHVKEILPSGLNNYEDMLHWLYRERRGAESFLEGIKAILIPIYIAFLGIMEFVTPISSFQEGTGSFDVNLPNGGHIWLYIILLFMIMIASTIVLGEAEKKVSFYVDFICIVEEKE